MPNTTGAQYQRLAGAGLESVMSRVEWDPNRNICLPQLMIGLTAATLSGDLYAVYDRIYNYGPHGTERIRCYLPADPAQLAAVRSSVLQQYSHFNSATLGGTQGASPQITGIVGQLWTESITTNFRLIPFAANDKEQTVAVNKPHEIFDAARFSQILDASAFASCP